MNSLLESIKDLQFFHQNEKILLYVALLLVIFLIAKSKLRALIGVIGIFLSFKLLCSCFPLVNSTPMAFGLAAGLSFAILVWCLMPLFYD